MSARVIPFPVHHGPMSELEHAVQCVQEAAMRVLGRTVPNDRARLLALLDIRLKLQDESSEIQ